MAYWGRGKRGVERGGGEGGLVREIRPSKHRGGRGPPPSLCQLIRQSGPRQCGATSIFPYCAEQSQRQCP